MLVHLIASGGNRVIPFSVVNGISSILFEFMTNGHPAAFKHTFPNAPAIILDGNIAKSPVYVTTSISLLPSIRRILFILDYQQPTSDYATLVIIIDGIHGVVEGVKMMSPALIHGR